MEHPRVVLPTLIVCAVLFGLAQKGCATGVPDSGGLCGDGILEADETCDDGNDAAGDGCDRDCAAESGYACDGEPSHCVAVCNDGIRVVTESCDGSDVGGTSCESLGLGTGVVTCDDVTCELDTSDCTANLCGNGVLDASEACDGADVGGESCDSQGYDGGTLACTGDCVIDTSSCTLSSCGNGIVEGVEVCDDANNAAGDGCSANCSVEAGWACVGQPSVCAELCGNGVQDAGEQCDGAALGAQTCESLGQGYVGGTLGCAINCTFNTAGCELPTCGNGVLDAQEQCDGVLLNGQTCESVGAYVGGTLLCLPSCAFDLSGCLPITCGDGIVSATEACDDGNSSSGDGCNILCNIETGWACTGEPSTCTVLCGNNQLDAGEQCDGAQLGGQGCTDLGFDQGTLACASSCTFDTAGCSTFSCGDSQVTGVEQCDGANLDGQTCQSVGAFVGGALVCTSGCAFDVSGCIPITCGDGIVSAGEQCDDNDTQSGDGCNAACQVENGWVCSGEPSTCQPSCGNAVWDPGEACDGADLHGGTCQSQGFAGGTLGCTAGCTFDTSGCLASVCPNGVREGSEACDGADLGGQDCTSFGFSGGTLACTGSCTIDTSGCSNAVCGNSSVEVGEQCDDGNTTGGDGCSASCLWEQTCTADDTSLTCPSSSVNNVSGVSGNDVSNNSCNGWSTGNDRVFSFVATGTSATASVDCDDWDMDYDVYILEGACNPSLCIDYGTSSGCDNVSFPTVPGLTYYIVVEYYMNGGWDDDFDIDLSCS